MNIKHPTEYLIILLFTTIAGYFCISNLAITIGGDAFGLVAELAARESSSVNIPNPIYNSLHTLLSAVTANPSYYINILFLLLILFPFLLVYFFIRQITSENNNTILVSVIGALIISSSAFNLLHFFAGHYAFNLLPVLCWLLAFFYWNNRYSIIWIGLAYGVNVVYNPYFGYFGIFIYLFSIAFFSIYAKSQFKSFVLKLFFSWIISAVIIIVSIYPALAFIIDAHNQPVGTVFNRPFDSVWGVLPWMYLLPSPQHWLASDWYIDFYRTAMIGSNVPENAVYLGLFNLIFFPYSFYLFWKQRLSATTTFWYRYALGAAILCFLLSLPPFIPLPNGEKFYWLSGYLHSWFPMFRIYSRFALFVLFFVTLGGMIGFYYFLNKYSPNKAKIIAIITLVLVLVDLTPQLPTLDLSKYPPVYEWLSKQPGNFMVYEIPEKKGKDDFQFYKFLYYQTIHGKKLANRKIDILLKENQVKYVIQHENLYQEGPIPTEYKNYVTKAVAEEKFNHGQVEKLPEWLVPVIKVGDAWVYQVK